MKIPLLIFAILVCLCFAAFPDEAGPTLNFERRYEQISAFFPRYEGSSKEKALHTYIISAISGKNVSVSIDDLGKRKNSPSFSSNLSVTIEGERKDCLIIAVPLNHPKFAESAESGSYAVALALELIERLASSPKPPITVRFAFLGAEFFDGGQNEDYPLGSKALLDSLGSKYLSIVLYLSFPVRPSIVGIKNFTAGVLSPSWFSERLLNAADKSSLVYRTYPSRLRFSRAGLSEESTRAETFLKASVPAAELTGIADGVRKAEDEFPLRFFAFVDDFLAENSKGFLDRWDIHYLLVSFLGHRLLLRESDYLFIMIGTFSLLLASTLILSIALRYRTKAFIRGFFGSFYVFLLYCALAYLLMWLASEYLRGRFLHLGSPGIWSSSPREYFALKVYFVSCVFFAFALFFHFFKLVRDGRSFYGAAALILFLADVFLFGVLDVAFSAYFLWSLAFAFISVSLGGRIAAVAGLVFSSYPAVSVFLEFFADPSMKVFGMLIVGDISSSAFLAFLLLPYLLLVIRTIILFKLVDRIRAPLFAFLLALFIASSVGTAGYAGYFYRFEKEVPNEAEIEKTFDLDSGKANMKVTAKSPLKQGYVESAGDRLDFNEPKAATTSAEIPMKKLIFVEQSADSFLSRSTFRIGLSFPESPYSVKIALRSEGSFALFDSNFPFVFDPNGRGGKFLVGIEPPNPLELLLTLPEGIEATCSVEACFLENPKSVKATLPFIAISSKSVAERSFRITER